MTSQTTLHRTISFEANARLAPPVSAYNQAMSSAKGGRRRRSSSIIYQEPAESLEQISDQEALPNLNSQWVNAKGSDLSPPVYAIHPSPPIDPTLTPVSRSLDDTSRANNRPQNPV